MSKESRVTVVLTETQAQMMLRAMHFALGGEMPDYWINDPKDRKRAEEAQEKLQHRLVEVASRAVAAGQRR